MNRFLKSLVSELRKSVERLVAKDSSGFRQLWIGGDLSPDPGHFYGAEYSVKLQEALDEPNKFKELADVRYTNTRVIYNPYGTDPTPASTTRSCPYTLQGVVQTTDSITMSSFYIVPQFIDRADLAQSTYQTQMDIATRQGILLNEQLESAFYVAINAGGTEFGTETLATAGTAGSTQITVSATNIDDVIRGIKREIRIANGESLFNRNGGYIVWRPQDMEILEGFMQANGFVTADTALKGGPSQGVRYMGLDHYSSNSLAANHVAAGVKKVVTLGILKDTYGQLVITQDPELRSGIGIISRVDYGTEVWVNTKPVTFAVNVV